MKKSIKVILMLLFAFLFFNLQNTFSQIVYGDAEFLIVNNTGNDNGFPITIDVYPVGAIFNGFDQYSPVAKYPGSLNNYIYGVYQFPLPNQTNQQYFAKINFDKSEYRENCPFTLGYGKYRIDFYVNSTKTFTCDVDFSDANYTGTTIPNQYIQQFLIEYRDNGTVWAKFNDPNASYYQIGNGNTFSVWNQSGTPYSPLIQDKGNFTDSQDPNPILHAFPLDATAFGHFAHVSPEEVNLNLNLNYYNAELTPDDMFKFSNCILNIGSKTFTINPSTINPYAPQMLITGEGAKFISGNGSYIYFPAYFTFKIEDGAQIEASGTYFQPYPNLPEWYGIILDHPGLATFDNCKFKNAFSSIQSSYNNYNGLSVTNSDFLIPSLNLLPSNTGIEITNASNVYIYNNTFDFVNPYSFCYGINIQINARSEEENNDAPWFRISIIKNTFLTGYIHFQAIGPTELISLYAKDNTFANAYSKNIILENVSGSFIHNTITNTIDDIDCILIDHGYSDFLDNTISGKHDNISIRSNSFPDFSPAQSNNQYLWKAGINNLTSISHYNINVTDNIYSCNFLTDNGKNTFTIGSSSNYHFFGKINQLCQETYFTRCNYWYGYNYLPKIKLYGINQLFPDCEIENIDWSQSNCDFDNQIVDRIITDKGNGVFDTILITQSNNSPPPAEDVNLFGTGTKNLKLMNYTSAINDFKNLINNYPYSKNLERSIYNLYECYVSSDTNHNQEWRNILFGDLENYLENKIQQYDSNETFISVAFDFILKSKIKIKSYQPAMDGYEFIAENSPSATERLLASISYLDVEGLLQGSSGGKNENQDYTDELSSDRNGKPIKDILLASYNKTKEQIKLREKSDLKNSNDVATTKAELNKKHAYDNKLESRALENISISGSLTKKERRERIQKDLMLLTSRGESTEKVIKKDNTTPIKYALSQNYPNPFNPVTNIKYQIQKTGIVTLKIYDVTGREIKTLVNEIKNPGSYLVSFNGSEFASGVYFYRIQSGDFVQVKKMVLIK